MANSKPDDSETLLQKSVDAARDACRWMNDALKEARKIAADCTAASRKATRERKISEPLEHKQALADVRVSNLAAELDQAKIELAELENDLARCRKTKQNQQDAAEFDKMIGTFADKFDIAIKANAELAESMEPLKSDLPDMLGTFLFFSNVAAESVATREMQLLLARQRRDAILAGSAKLSRPAPLPAPIPLPPPVTHVTALKPVTWIDHQGAVQIAAAADDIDLPPQTAKHAIKINAVCTMDDERRKTIKSSGGFKVGKPLFRNCVQLSDDMVDPDPEPFAQPVLRSVPPNTVDPRFTPIDRGPPIQMQVARNEPVPATRNISDKDKS
jgi:hypothetical protein